MCSHFQACYNSFTLINFIVELFTLLACVRCNSDCRSASVISLPAEGGGKRAIDFYIKMSLMRAGGWAWSKAYWSWWPSVIRFQWISGSGVWLNAMMFSCLCSRGFVGLHKSFKSSKLSQWGRAGTLTKYLTAFSFILVIHFLLFLYVSHECVVVAHVIAICNEAHNPR